MKRENSNKSGEYEKARVIKGHISRARQEGTMNSHRMAPCMPEIPLANFWQSPPAGVTAHPMRTKPCIEKLKKREKYKEKEKKKTLNLLGDHSVDGCQENDSPSVQGLGKEEMLGFSVFRFGLREEVGGEK